MARETIYTEALREAIGKLDARRGADRQVRDELSALDRWIDRIKFTADGHLRRIAWLEAERKTPEAGYVLEALTSVLRAGGDALMQQRHSSIASKLARITLDDPEVAVVIDSLAAMRDQLTEQGVEAPNVTRALAKFQAVVTPDTSVVEVV